MDEPAIRPATDHDVAAIRRVGEATWPVTYAFAGGEYVARGLATWWSDDAVRRGLATTTTLVAETVEGVIGMGNVDLRPQLPIIWKLYVAPDHHGTGAGHALLEALVGVAAPHASAVLLEYVAGNDRAAAFYRRHGFTELRRDAPEREGWPEQVWMTRDTAGPLA